MTKTHIPDNLRQRLWNAERLICCYCQSQQAVSGIKLTIDHIMPEALGGGTAVGRATIATLDLNRSHLVETRQRWVKAGWHPPKL